MVVKLYIQVMFGYSICGFCLAISLRMHRGRKIAFYSKLCIQLLIFLVIKLLPIVSHNHIGYATSTMMSLQMKLLILAFVIVVMGSTFTHLVK